MTRGVKIDIDTLGDAGLHIGEPLTAAWVRACLGDDPLFVPTGDGAMALHLLRHAATVFVRGQVRLPLQAPCSRCLAPVQRQFVTPIEVTLVPIEARPTAHTDGELTNDDVSVGTYADDVVDLDPVLHDEILLELPIQMLCQTACSGLCRRCGTNLNDRACGCSDAVEAGPLRALAHLRLPGSDTKKDS